VATGVTALVNVPATTNLTKIIASVYGDRVELRALSPTRLAPPMVLNLQEAPIATNITPVLPPSFVSSAVGTAGSLSTFITASRNTFLDSPIRALLHCNVSGTVNVGTWLQISVVKASGARVNIGVTNQSVSGTPYSLASDLVNAINAAQLLQGPDGVSADNPSTGGFDVDARAAGIAGTAVKARLAGSSGLSLFPSNDTSLSGNPPDLQPRNHLYIRAGATNLALAFPLDSRTLSDGFHELTAVAYEGSHVRTQTKISLPVVVQNTSLTATMSLLDFASTNSVPGAYHIQVTANTNNISAIRLFSTGGQLDSVTNQSSATFTVNGSALGVGLHPFYALVQTAGATYRTQPQFARFVYGP
jgi:hypothetical protein